MTGGLQSATAWWNARSNRERVLLIIMAALTAAVVVWFGAVQPLRRGASAAAEARVESAAQLAEARAIADRLDARQRRFGGRLTPAALDDLIVATAAQQGVVLDSRQSNGAAVTVWATTADSKRVFNWLALLQRQHGVGVASLTAIPGEGGAIQVQAALAGPP